MEEHLERKKVLERRIDFRLSEEKYRELTGLVAKTKGVSSLSQLLRKILEEGKFIQETYDPSRDKLLEELSGIRSELHSIGVNINEVTRHFQRSNTPEARLGKVLELTRLFQQTDLRITGVFEVIGKMAEGWLPK